MRGINKPTRKQTSKCKYCANPVPKGCIRCDNCDAAWQNGHRAGWDEHKGRVTEAATTLKRLLGL